MQNNRERNLAASQQGSSAEDETGRPTRACDICGRTLRPEAHTRCAPCIVNVSQWRTIAADRGREAAEAQASWTVDGNTKTEFVGDVLRMIEEGDPAGSDYLPAMPTLSGEWAGDPTPQSLARDIAGEDLPGFDVVADELAEAWEEAVAERFESACAEHLRAALPLTCPECGEEVWDGPRGHKLAKCWNSEGHESGAPLAFDTMPD